MILVSQEDVDGPLEFASLMLSPRSTVDESSRPFNGVERGANNHSANEQNVLLTPLRPTRTPSPSDE